MRDLAMTSLTAGGEGGTCDRASPGPDPNLRWREPRQLFIYIYICTYISRGLCCAQEKGEASLLPCLSLHLFVDAAYRLQWSPGRLWILTPQKNHTRVSQTDDHWKSRLAAPRRQVLRPASGRHPTGSRAGCRTLLF